METTAGGRAKLSDCFQALWFTAKEGFFPPLLL